VYLSRSWECDSLENMVVNLSHVVFHKESSNDLSEEHLLLQNGKI